MLDNSIQVPRSLPYPGWEQYYKPYDGRIYQTTYQSASGKESTLESSPEKCSTCVDKDKMEKPLLAGEASASIDRDDFEIPAWARDINGYYWCLKALSGPESSSL